MEIHDVVKKLIGKIEPIGETQEDERRFNNLKDMCDLVNKLVSDIDDVAFGNKNRHEHSMKNAGLYASKFLDDLGIKE